MKEPIDYRAEIESIVTATGKHLLTISEAARYLGRDRVWTKEHFTFDKCNMIAATTLAREMHSGK